MGWRWFKLLDKDSHWRLPTDGNHSWWWRMWMWLLALYQWGVRTGVSIDLMGLAWRAYRRKFPNAHVLKKISMLCWYINK